jgi:PPOX class probable F420-dependent enzyme
VVTPDALDADALAFLAERHLATLSVPRADGSIQVTPVGVTWSDDGVARVIASGRSAKARRIAAAPGLRVTACQVDGPRWLALEGPATLTDDPERVELAVERYAARYRRPVPNPERVAIEIAVDRITGRW